MILKFGSFYKNACLLAGALVFSGCSRNRAPNFPILSGATEPGALVIHEEKFAIDEQSFEADYGTIVVPESDQNNRRLQLHVIRIRAKQPNGNPPIFYFGPGPGQSNLAFQPPPALLEKHDLVIVGYRGVDNLVPLYCPAIDRAFLGQKDDLGQKTRDSLAVAVNNCIAFLRESGVSFEAYGVGKVVEDIEAVREAFSYNRILILGEAFGGRIASIYSHKFPEAVEKMILLAPPIPGNTLLSGEEIDQQLQVLAEKWQTGGDNENRRFDMLATMRRALQNAPEHWLIFRIDPGKIRMASYFMLRHRHSAAMVFDTFAAAGGGDASGLALLTQAYDMLIPSSNNWAVFFANIESSGGNDDQKYPAGETALGAPFPEIISSAITARQSGNHAADSMFTPTNTTETLIFTGNFDITTSAEAIGKTWLATMPNAKQIVLSDVGHTTDIWSVDPPAIQNAMLAFFDGDVVVSSDFSHHPISFEVGVGFPKAAKIAVALALLVFMLIVGGFVLIAKLFKQKPAYR